MPLIPSRRRHPVARRLVAVALAAAPMAALPPAVAPQAASAAENGGPALLGPSQPTGIPLTQTALQPPAAGGGPVQLPDVPVPVEENNQQPNDAPAPPAPPQPPAEAPNGGRQGNQDAISETAIQSAGDSSTIGEFRLDTNISPNIADALRYEPGVQIFSSPGRFGINSINIRGLEANRVLIQVDGVRTPDAYNQGPINIGRNSIDTSLVKQIDITRGAGSLIYGEGALGGVVNFQTKDPVDFLNTFGNDQYFGFRQGIYTADVGFQETLTVAQRVGDWEGAFSYTRRDGHDLEAVSNAFPTDYQRYRNDYMLGKLAYVVDQNTRLTLATEWLYDNIDTDLISARGVTIVADQTAPGFPFRGANRYSALAQDNNNRLRYSIRLDSIDDTRDWGQNLRAELYYQQYSFKDSRRQDYLRTTGPIPRQHIFDVQTNDFSQNMFGGRIIFRDEYDAELASHSAVYGVDALGTDTVRFQDGFVRNETTGVQQSTNFIGERTPAKIIPDITTIRVGMFWRDQMNINDSPWWFAPGVRVNYYSQVPHLDPLFDSSVGVIPQTLQTWNAQPYLEIGAQLTDRTRGVTRYQRGFRGPPVEDAAIGFTNTGFGYVILPNANLDPEVSDGVETGVTYQGEYLVAYANTYYTYYSNFIENVTVGTNGQGQTVFQQQNLRAQIYGGELAAELRLSGVLENDGNFAGWSVYGNVTRLVGDSLSTDRPLDSIPPTFGMVGLRYRAEGGQWGAEANTTLIDQKDRISRTTVNQFISPGYANLDLLAYAQLNDNAKLNVGLFNVFNSEYYNWLNVRGVAANNVQLGRYSLPGINFGGTLTLQY